tara:strand:- start:17321 stop:18457 length:1137 start_codon:yes stop_codon:yes gene_type:complete
MPYASSLSTHNDSGIAVAEALGEILDKLGSSPDLALLFVSGAFVAQVEDLALAVNEILRPETLLGSTAISVVSGETEIEEQTAISMFAGNFDGQATPVRLDDDLLNLNLKPGNEQEGGPPHTLILLADPFSFQAEEAISKWRSHFPGLQIIGGLASAGNAPRMNRLVLGDHIFDSGAVGVLLSGSVEVEPLVSQGCRPIGSPLIVTKSDGNLVYELAGQAALARLEEVIAQLTDHERALVASGLHVGRVIDEHRSDFSRGDFLIRAVLGADQKSGVVAVGDVIPVGSTIQFQVRDADSAHEDLHLLASGIEPADGALLFTCNGRGENLFDAPHHDANVLAPLVAGGAVSGMFCAGEIGPVGPHSFLHGFTASAAIFRD